MFEPGDLVQVNLDCNIKYFWGKTAIVLQNMGQDATDHSYGFYYRLQFDDGAHHIFTHRELVLLSKGRKKKE